LLFLLNALESDRYSVSADTQSPGIGIGIGEVLLSFSASHQSTKQPRAEKQKKCRKIQKYHFTGTKRKASAVQHAAQTGHLGMLGAVCSHM